MVKRCKCEYIKDHTKGSITYYSKFQVKKLFEGWIRISVTLSQCNFTEVDGDTLVCIS